MKYPEHNPFPPQAVTTIEGINWSTFLKEPTFERPAIKQVVGVTRRYQEDSSGERVGRAVAVHGDHGTGKTHCLAYALAMVWTSGHRQSRHPVILYARADNSQELALYRRLVARLSFTEFRDLVAQSFAGYAVEAFERERTTDESQREDVSKLLHSDPNQVLTAVERGDISFSGILDVQEKDIERVQGRVGNFERALQGLFNPQLSTLAYQWMVGQELTDAELRVLGVQGNLNDAVDARTAIHVLAAVARRAGRCFYVALDQAEAFLIDDSNRLSKRAAGFLRSLLEVVVKEAGCFAVSMNNDSWASIPRDLRQRLGPAPVTMMPLTIAEASGVVSAYVSPWRRHDGDTFPLTREAIQQLLVLSGGNVRRFLQACFLAFQHASVESRAIDGRLVLEEVRRDFSATSPSEFEVRNQIMHNLRRIGARFVTDTTIADRPVDFAVMDGERPTVLLQVTQPMFALDEAEQAVRNLDLIRAARARGTSAVLVIVGYSSPDVVERLEKAAERVFIADGADYVTRLAAVIETEIGEQRGVGEGPSPLEYDQLRDELLRLQRSRAEDEGTVRGALREISDAQAAEVLPRQLAEFRRTWLTEHQRLRDDIKRIRGEQQKQDIQEVAALHASYLDRVRDRRSRFTLLVTSGAGVMTLLFFLLMTTSGSFYSPQLVTALVAGLVALTVAAMLILNLMRRPTSAPVPLSTLDDLRRVARVEISRRDRLLSLDSEDPYVRYAALLRRSSGRDEAWERVLDSEPARLLRVEISRMMCARGGDEIDHIARLGDADVISVAIEAAGRQWETEHDTHLLERFAEQPAPLVSLAVFHGLPIDPVSLLGRFVQELRQGVLVNGERDPWSQLAQAYLSDDDGVLLEAVRWIPERELRRASDELGPQERHGLCGFYWLKAVPELDEMYVFFRKALLLSTTGLT